MNQKVPAPLAFLILALACYLGWQMGVNAAGPMPVIVRETPEPERNYLQETLRILNQPKTQVIERVARPQPCGNTMTMLMSSVTIVNGMPAIMEGCVTSGP